MPLQAKNIRFTRDKHPGLPLGFICDGIFDFEITFFVAKANVAQS